MDDAALGDPMIVGILVKGRGEYSIRENPHAGGEQDGCAELLAISSGITAILGICIENLLIAGGVKGGEQGNGPGNLREGKHHFVHRGKVFFNHTAPTEICVLTLRDALPSRGEDGASRYL